MAANTKSKDEIEEVTIIFNGIISQGKPFAFSINKNLIATVPFLEALVERWVKHSAQEELCQNTKEIIEIHMNEKNNVIPSSIKTYFSLKQQFSKSEDMSNALSQLDTKAWLDLFEIIVHFADFSFYDQYIVQHLPNYKMFSHSIHFIPAHMIMHFGEQYFNDCLTAKYRCTICNNYNYYCGEKEEFDELAEDLKEKIYSIFKNGCSIHDHNASIFIGHCDSPTCPDRSFKIDGWDVLQLGHILHNLANHMNRLSDLQKESFSSFTVDDLCICRYSFDDTFIKFIKTDERWAEFVWDHCDKLELLLLFDLEQKTVDNLIEMNFDQLVKYIDQNTWKTPKKTCKPKCHRSFRYIN